MACHKKTCKNQEVVWSKSRPEKTKLATAVLDSTFHLSYLRPNQMSFMSPATCLPICPLLLIVPCYFLIWTSRGVIVFASWVLNSHRTLISSSFFVKEAMYYLSGILDFASSVPKESPFFWLHFNLLIIIAVSFSVAPCYLVSHLSFACLCFYLLLLTTLHITLLSILKYSRSIYPIRFDPWLVNFSFHRPVVEGSQTPENFAAMPKWLHTP